MKSLTRFAIAIVATAASVFTISCTRLENKEDLSGGGKVFHASFETAGIPDTKTYIDSNHKMRWTEGDRISVFEGNTNNQQYRYKGQTGETSADFEKVSSDSYSENKISSNYAVYPYLQDNKISKDEKLTVKLPSVQQYAEGSFGLGANTMVAVTNGTDNTFLSFKNLCGYLVIRLYGEGTVKRIFFKGNNGEKITGVATIAASYGQNPSVSMDQSASDEIILDCGSGVELGSTSSTATEFWFCIPPVEFSKGFSITVTDTAGGVMEKSLSSSKTISRNTINSMSAIKAEFSEPATPVPEMVDLGLSVKWATCNIGANKPEEYGGYYQWAGIQDVTNTTINLGFDNCPYHTPGADYSIGWTKYVQSDKSASWAGTGNPDNKTVLDPEDDIAYVTLGDKWRMPTDAEWTELRENCTWTWTDNYNGTGVAGRIVTSNITGYTDKSIFLPAAGYRDELSLLSTGINGCYWSSSLESGRPYLAYWVLSYSSNVRRQNCYRFYGNSVRPVYGGSENEKVKVTGVSLEPTSISLNVGETYTLSATVTPSNAAEQGVSWSIDNTSVATIDQSGKVTAVKAGSATITVKTDDGGYTAICSVSVANPGSIVMIATPDAVDLGLSVKWASFNLGATNPEEYGCYYQWAGVEYLPINVEIGDNNCPYFNPVLDIFTGWTKYFLSKWSFYMSYSGDPDNKTVLDSDDDVAYVTLGGKWRMPTIEEFEELYNNCIWTLGQLNGIIGYKVTSNMPGYTDKSIFLPAAGLRESTFLNYVGSHGFYWSSSLDKESPFRACGIRFNLDQVDMYSIARSAGISVRPVYGDRKKVTGVSLYPTSLNMDLRETYTLSAAITPSNASEQGVFWTSSDTDVATVDQSGNVTAVKLGSATITVKTVDGGYTATCNVTVVAPTPEAVDLGLSVKWASFNLGATKPLEFGNFYQWAGLEDVTNKSINVDIDNAPYYIGHSWVKYITSNKSTWYSDPASPDNKTVLDPEDDIAHMTLGGKWRMPTKAEWEELIENCIWETYKNSGGTWISVVTSTKPGYTDKYIILPSTGYRYDYIWLEDGSAFYWSSSLYPDNHDGAYICTFKEMYSTNAAYVGSTYRFYGFSIRPVSD